jgi:septal ring factor EnvC (AmiA/AmiB activator)
MPKLDLKRLRADVDQHEKERAADPGRRRLTGAMAIVRDHLKDIEALKAAGKSWVAIAAGLAEQGVTQGDNQPITAKRLTALIASVKREAARRAEKEARRAERRDVALPTPPPRRVASLRLADELANPPRNMTPAAAPTEEDIRRANFDKHAKLFRKEQT